MTPGDRGRPSSSKGLGHACPTSFRHRSASRESLGFDILQVHQGSLAMSPCRLSGWALPRVSLWNTSPTISSVGPTRLHAAPSLHLLSCRVRKQTDQELALGGSLLTPTKLPLCPHRARVQARDCTSFSGEQELLTLSRSLFPEGGAPRKETPQGQWETEVVLSTPRAQCPPTVPAGPISSVSPQTRAEAWSTEVRLREELPGMKDFCFAHGWR